jgi:hypothetical protein
MKTKKMPGFTAEASMYITGRNYYVSNTERAINSTTMIVVPQVRTADGINIPCQFTEAGCGWFDGGSGGGGGGSGGGGGGGEVDSVFYNVCRMNGGYPRTVCEPCGPFGWFTCCKNFCD